jgi:hypothetical protein
VERPKCIFCTSLVSRERWRFSGVLHIGLRTTQDSEAVPDELGSRHCGQDALDE